MLCLSISPLLLSVFPQQGSVLFPSHSPRKREAVSRAGCLPELSLSSPLCLEKRRTHPQEGIVEPELTSRSGDVGGIGEMASRLY